MAAAAVPVKPSNLCGVKDANKEKNRTRDRVCSRILKASRQNQVGGPEQAAAMLLKRQLRV